MEKLKQRDNGIIGAYRCYLTDRDLGAFKLRVMQRALTPESDARLRYGVGAGEGSGTPVMF